MTPHPGLAVAPYWWRPPWSNPLVVLSRTSKRPHSALRARWRSWLLSYGFLPLPSGCSTDLSARLG